MIHLLGVFCCELWTDSGRQMSEFQRKLLIYASWKDAWPSYSQRQKYCFLQWFINIKFSKDPEIIARQNEFVPAHIMEEICRFGGTEPHVIAAILGGCVAQEVIKLCTHQYVPVDNSIIFDGHSQQAASFRVIKQWMNASNTNFISHKCFLFLKDFGKSKWILFGMERRF